MISYRLSDLALLYQLFSRVKRGQDELCCAFNEYVKVTQEIAAHSRCINKLTPVLCISSLIEGGVVA